MICAGNHREDNCDNKENVKCINCEYSNSKFNTNRCTEHKATDKGKCESYRYLLSRVVNNTDYPYNPIKNG